MAKRPLKARQRRHILEPWKAKPRRVYSLPIGAIDPIIRSARRRIGTVYIPQSFIPDFQFTYVLSGQGRVVFLEHAYELGPGHFFCIPPYRRLSFMCPDPNFDMMVVLFDLSPKCPGVPTSQRLLDPMNNVHDVRFLRGYKLPTHTVYGRGNAFEPLFHELVQSFNSPDPLSKYRAKVLLHRMLLHLLERSRVDPKHRSGSASAQSKVEYAVTWIDQQLSQPLSIADLAERAGLSVGHFIRAFRQWVGQTPIEYLLHRRLDEAKRLLGDMHLSIKEISLRVGFSDPLYFSRIFHRIEGQSPTQYRQTLKPYSGDYRGDPLPENRRPSVK